MKAAARRYVHVINKSQNPKPKTQKIPSALTWNLGFGIWDLGFGIYLRAKLTRLAFAPAPVATTTNCRPDRVLYVIGVALTGNGVATRDISRPVALSNA